MIITLTDAWAEDEIERQLRALTPISCVEEAEANYKSQYAELKSRFNNQHDLLIF